MRSDDPLVVAAASFVNVVEAERERKRRRGLDEPRTGPIEEAYQHLRTVVGREAGTVCCPHCGRLKPVGHYCALCQPDEIEHNGLKYRRVDPAAGPGL